MPVRHEEIRKSLQHDPRSFAKTSFGLLRSDGYIERQDMRVCPITALTYLPSADSAIEDELRISSAAPLALLASGNGLCSTLSTHMQASKLPGGKRRGKAWIRSSAMLLLQQ